MTKRGRPTKTRTSPLGIVIQSERKKLEWTVRDLANRAGVPYKTLSKLELGQVIPRRPEILLIKIAQAFDVYPDKLLIPASLTPILRPIKSERPPEEKSIDNVELKLTVTEDERCQLEKFLEFLRYIASIEALRVKAEKEVNSQL